MRIRRAANLFLITVVVLLGAVIVGSLALHTPYARRYVANRIEQAAGPQLGLQIADLNYNLWTGSVSLDGLRLGTANPTFLTIDHIDLDLPLLQLLQGDIIINRAIANGVVVNLVIDQNGQSNLPQFGDSGQPASDLLPDILIRQLTADGSLQIDDQPDAAGISLPQWTLGITGTPGPRHDVDFELDAPGTLRYQGQTQPLDQLALNAGVQRNAVNLTSLQLSTQGLTLTSTDGTVDRFSNPLADISLRAQIDLEPLLQLVGIDPGMPVAGQLDTAITASNREGSFTLDTQLSGQGLRVDTLQQLGINAGASWNSSTGVVDVDFATITAPQGQTQLAGTWRGTAPGDLNDFTGAIGRLNLRSITQMLNAPVQVASNAAGTFRVQWPGQDYAQLTLQTNLRLNATAATAQNVVPLSGGLGINLRDRGLTADLRSIRSMGASLDGNIRTGLNLAAPTPLNGPLSGMVTVQVDDAGVTLI